MFQEIDQRSKLLKKGIITKKNRTFTIPGWARMESGLGGDEVELRFRSAAESMQSGEAAASFYLAEIERRGIWRELGFSSVIHYARQAGDISEKKAYALLRIGHRLREFRKIRRAFMDGRVSWTKVRELLRLKTISDEESVLEKVESLTNRELERFISTENASSSRPKALPALKTVNGQLDIFDQMNNRRNMVTGLPAGGGGVHTLGENTAKTGSLQNSREVTTAVPEEARTFSASFPEEAHRPLTGAQGGAQEHITVTLKMTPVEYVLFQEAHKVWKCENKGNWKREDMCSTFSRRYLEEKAIIRRSKSAASISEEPGVPLNGAAKEARTDTDNPFSPESGTFGGNPPDCDTESSGLTGSKAACGSEAVCGPEDGAAEGDAGAPEFRAVCAATSGAMNPGSSRKGSKSSNSSSGRTGSGNFNPGVSRTANPALATNGSHAELSSPGSLPVGGSPVLFDSPYSIVIHHCPECKKNAISGKRGELFEVEDNQVERALCDGSVYVEKNGRAGRRKRSVSPALRKKIFMRDRGVCRTPGCERTSFLEVHHVVPVSDGGSNDPENLILQCSRCHISLHEGRLRIEGRYPDFDFLHVGKIGMINRAIRLAGRRSKRKVFHSRS